MSRKTAVYGYLLNGIIVIYGTVFMAHFSFAEMAAKSIPLQAMFLKSTLPDIMVAWADFFAGKALYDLYMKGPIVEEVEEESICNKTLAISNSILKKRRAKK